MLIIIFHAHSLFLWFLVLTQPFQVYQVFLVFAAFPVYQVYHFSWASLLPFSLSMYFFFFLLGQQKNFNYGLQEDEFVARVVNSASRIINLSEFYGILLNLGNQREGAEGWKNRKLWKFLRFNKKAGKLNFFPWIKTVPTFSPFLLVKF